MHAYIFHFKKKCFCLPSILFKSGNWLTTDQGFMWSCIEISEFFQLFFHNLFNKSSLFSALPLSSVSPQLMVQHSSNTVKQDNWLYPLYLLRWCWIQGLAELFLKSICLYWFHLFLAVKICGSYTIAHSNSLSPSLLLQFKAINPARGG